MNPVAERLRRGDPLKSESHPDAVGRARARDAMLRASTLPSPGSHRRNLSVLVLAVALALVVGPTLGTRVWNAFESPAFAAVRVEIRLAEGASGPGLIAAPVGQEGHVVYLHQEVLLTNDDIVACKVVAGSGPDHYGVEFRFSAEGSRRLREATRAHVGRPLAVLFDGRVILAPVVRSEIGELGVLSGAYDRDTAERIARGVMLGGEP